MIKENLEISIVSNRKHRESRFIIIFQNEGERKESIRKNARKETFVSDVIGLYCAYHKDGNSGIDVFIRRSLS